MIYFDAAYIAKCYLNEPGADRVREVAYGADGARTAILDMPITVFLRSGDALHLACAEEHGFQKVYTNDRHMLEAARLFHLTGVNVLSEQG